ncbi:hypothetical protein [Nocardia sp. NPDC056000]|uniref:hypothetical protein n=1 Tax=Nocardia sp. NPDC056000 TaxID=3345674 RepID=UPI0035DE1A87
MSTASDIGSALSAVSVRPMPSSVLDSNSTVRPDIPNELPWTPLGRIAFRLLFTVGGSALVLFVYGNVIGLNLLIMPLKTALAQAGSLLLRGDSVTMDTSNSGDTLGDWCALVGCLLVGIPAAILWSALDRQRDNYRRLARAFFEVARIGLVVELIAYGMAKAVPIQMGYMTQPAHQLPSVGDVGLKDTLWPFMGASNAYSIATGLAEITAGVLLLWRRTWLAGGLLAIVAMAQVFLLNLCYDVPVKIVSGTLLATAIALTLPYWASVTRVLTNSTPLPPRRLWAAPGTRRVRIGAASLGFFVVVAHSALIAAIAIPAIINIHSPRSALDGQWEAISFTVDGVPAAMTGQEPSPWANVAITDRTEYTSFVSQTPQGATTLWALDITDETLAIRQRLSDPPTNIRYRLDGNTLVLSGTIDNHHVEGRYRSRVMERANSHFRLVQPGPDDNLPTS